MLRTASINENNASAYNAGRSLYAFDKCTQDQSNFSAQFQLHHDWNVINRNMTPKYKNNNEHLELLLAK